MADQRSEGWYPDPDNPERLRWFDGQSWGRVEPLDNEAGLPTDNTFWAAVEKAPARGAGSRWTVALLWSPLLTIPLILIGRLTKDPALALGAAAILLGWCVLIAINAVNARRQPPRAALPAAVSALPTFLIVGGAVLP